MTSPQTLHLALVILRGALPELPTDDLVSLTEACTSELGERLELEMPGVYLVPGPVEEQ